MLAGDAAMDLELLVKIEGEARRAVRALNLKTAAKRGPTFAEVVARIAAEEVAGRPGILLPVALVPTLKTPVLRVLRVPAPCPFSDQPPQWGFS